MIKGIDFGRFWALPSPLPSTSHIFCRRGRWSKLRGVNACSNIINQVASYRRYVQNFILTYVLLLSSQEPLRPRPTPRATLQTDAATAADWDAAPERRSDGNIPRVKGVRANPPERTRPRSGRRCPTLPSLPRVMVSQALGAKPIYARLFYLLQPWPYYD